MASPLKAQDGDYIRLSCISTCNADSSLSGAFFGCTLNKSEILAEVFQQAKREANSCRSAHCSGSQNATDLALRSPENDEKAQAFTLSLSLMRPVLRQPSFRRSFFEDRPMNDLYCGRLGCRMMAGTAKAESLEMFNIVASQVW